MIFQGKTKQGDFALETSVKAISYYKDFFGVPYPLPKYDCIAISDFSCGAMENWGLVTFRETAVLVDSQNTSAKAKQWIAIGSFFNVLLCIQQIDSILNRYLYGYNQKNVL